MTLSLNSIVKYIIEGIAVSSAAYLITGRTRSLKEVGLLGLTAGLTFMILDLFTNGIGLGARQGSGFAIGAKTVGFGYPFEGFASADDSEGFDGEHHDEHDGLEMFDGSGCQTESPYRFSNPSGSQCPQQIVGHSASSSEYGQTKVGTRWMKWNENAKPVNQNTNEYKLVPGLYAKLILQPGYNEGVIASNATQISQLANYDPRLTEKFMDNTQHENDDQDQDENQFDKKKTSISDGNHN